MAKRDFYEVLGVSRTATDKEIRQAYRRLARKHHPDVNPGDKSAEARFKEINEAYQVLSNAEDRKKYDQFGEDWKYADRMAAAGAAAGGSRGGGFGTWSFSRGGRRGSTAADPFEGIDLGDLGDLFGRFGGRQGDGPFAMPGQDIESQVQVTLEEAFHGTTRLLAVADQRGGSRRLEVKVPAGVKTGSRIRVAGEGSPGMGGGPKGDLWLVITVLPHEIFQREGDDLKVEVGVPLEDALLGGEVQVPTLKGGHLALKLPAGTQNAQSFRLRGQGMPNLEGGKGDLYAKVKVVLPTSLTPEEKDFFERMRARRVRYAGRPVSP
jgi:DnaJ-class molecular chaperone